MAKIVAGITVAYALSPIDLIPDFIPVLGYLDDVILLPALLALTIHLIPHGIWERSRALSADLWKEGMSYADLWCLALWLLIKAIWF